MKSADIETVATALEQARQILGDYIEPGPRSAEGTLQRLLAILDDEGVVNALDHIRRRRAIRLVE